MLMVPGHQLCPGIGDNMLHMLLPFFSSLVYIALVPPAADVSGGG